MAEGTPRLAEWGVMNPEPAARLRLLLPVLALGAALAIGGCAAPSDASPTAASSSAKAPSQGLTGARWQLGPGAWFELSDNKLTGNDSCNGLGGAARLSGSNGVDFGSGPVSTMMYCPDPTGTQAAIRAALTGPKTWQRDGDRLTLTDPTTLRSWTFTAG
jgi:heat shock protein HslJ